MKRPERESTLLKLRVDCTWNIKGKGDGGVMQQENDKIFFGGWDIKQVVQFEMRRV